VVKSGVPEVGNWRNIYSLAYLANAEGELFNQNASELFLAQGDALLVYLDVPTAAERGLTHKTKTRAGAYPNIQQLTGQALVRETIYRSGHSGDKMRGCGAARERHFAEFGCGRKYTGKLIVLSWSK
jgi:hypothetical protein